MICQDAYRETAIQRGRQYSYRFDSIDPDDGHIAGQPLVYRDKNWVSQ